jgi:hypothetical protein
MKKKNFLIDFFAGKSKKKKEETKSSTINFVPSCGLNDTYLFDFKNWASQYNGFIGTPIAFTTAFTQQDPIAPDGTVRQQLSVPIMPKKVKVKPIDVLNELETIPTPFSLAMVDEKIEILKDKEKLIAQEYAKREVVALIERLENRKKYAEFKEFFDKYPNTTDEKIENLLEKYELVMKTSDIFIPEFPDEAVSVMKEYTKKLDEICGKKPIFYVIAEAKDFKKAYEKRDPILLVQSPFGFYWQILGAWDKEMLLLSEL